MILYSVYFQKCCQSNEIENRETCSLKQKKQLLCDLCKRVLLCIEYRGRQQQVEVCGYTTSRYCNAESAAYWRKQGMRKRRRKNKMTVKMLQARRDRWRGSKAESNLHTDIVGGLHCACRDINQYIFNRIICNHRLYPIPYFSSWGNSYM